MLAPIVFAAFLGVAVIVLIYLIWKGDIASGETVRIELSGSCMEDARPIIEKRVMEVGLGSPVLTETGNTLQIQAVLPELDNAKETIPKLLSRRGVLEMRHNGNVVLQNANIQKAKLNLDESGMPETLLILDKNARVELQQYLDQHKNDISEIWLDDQFIINRPNTIQVGEEFRLVSEATNPKIRMQESVDFVILFSNGVLPCEITLDSIQQLE